MFGFPKHPVPAVISCQYDEAKSLVFEATHEGKMALKVSCAVPQPVTGEDGAPLNVVPLDLEKCAPDAQIGAPRLGGTHKGHNGTIQSFYKTSVHCHQHVAGWNSEKDSLEFGDAEHFAPLSRWDFAPVVKAHSTDFKIVAYKPSGWISGEEAATAVQEHEKQIAGGLKAG